jgi:hypothetical protein
MTTQLNTNQLRANVNQALRDIERNPRPFACSWEELFSDTPEGDFDWTQEEAVEWALSEDDGYEGGWRKDAYCINLKRVGGVETVEFTTVDCDGNWDLLAEFSNEDADSEELAFELATVSCHYQLLRNALYSLHVVETGEDPLEQTLSGNPREVHAKGLEREIDKLCSYVKSKLPETN